MASVHLVYFFVSLAVCSMEFVVLPNHYTWLHCTMQKPMLSCHKVVAIASADSKGVHVYAFGNGSNGRIRFKIITNLHTSRVESCLYEETTCRTLLYPSAIEDCRQGEFFTIEHIVSSQRKLAHIGS